jgi:hypothetical protein
MEELYPQKDTKKCPCAKIGKIYLFKSYYVPILPNVAKTWVQTKANFGRVSTNEVIFTDLQKEKPQDKAFKNIS